MPMLYPICHQYYCIMMGDRGQKKFKPPYTAVFTRSISLAFEYGWD